MALFEAINLHKRFGDRVVLEDISLKFEEGQLSGIMGPNGAGKTTCFNVLTGGYTPDRGQVIFDGVDITGLSPHAIARHGISRSFQIINLFDEYSVIENILVAIPDIRLLHLNMIKHVGSNSAAWDKAVAVLESVGLKGKEFESTKNLSYGERRVLEIGVALASEPRLLFLDEPTSGLGTDATARLAELISVLKQDRTIVIIEHDMHFLFNLADQISVIHWGQVICQGKPEELAQNKWVRKSNLGAVVSS